jgi:hypothetical protein
MEEKQTCQWTPEVEALYAAPILAYPPPRERFVVDIDASYFGIGGALSQVQDGQERIIAHYIKMLNKLREITVTRWELLTIVRKLEHFYKYLCEQEFHLHTDHSALTWLMSFKNLEGQTACCIQLLQE